MSAPTATTDSPATTDSTGTTAATDSTGAATAVLDPGDAGADPAASPGDARGTASAPDPSGRPVSDAPRGLAITSFVLGIVSIVSGWTFFAPLTGLILGIIALQRRTADRTLALWGVWLNAAMLAIWAILAVVFAAMLGFSLLALPVLAA